MKAILEFELPEDNMEERLDSVETERNRLRKVLNDQSHRHGKQINEWAVRLKQVREALEEAVAWIEDDRFGEDYISEDWYHLAKAALKEPARNAEPEMGERIVRNLEDEYAKLWQMYGDLEDERDRLREALDVLAEEYAAKLKVSAASVKESAFEIAAERKALQEAGDE